MPQKRRPVGNASSSRLVTLNFLSMGYNAGVSGEIKEQVRHPRKGLEAMLEPFFFCTSFSFYVDFFFFCPYLPWKVSPLLWTINTLSRTIISARSFCIFFLLACKWIRTRNKFPTKGGLFFQRNYFACYRRLCKSLKPVPTYGYGFWKKHFVWIIMIYVHGIFGKHYIHTKDSLRPDKDGCALCEPHSVVQSRQPRSDMLFFFSPQSRSLCSL